MSSEQKKSNGGFLIQGMILAAAGIITRLIGIAYRIPVNNILGDEGQGLYGYAFSIYNIALLLTSYSLPLAVSKLVSARISKKEYKNAMRIFKSAMLFALVVGAIVGIIIFVFSDFIAGDIYKQPYSAYALRVLAPGLFIVAIMGVLRGLFQGMGTMIPTALSQILEQIVNAIVSIIGASYLLEMGKKAAESKVEPSLPFAYGAAGGTLGTVSGALFGLIFLCVVFGMFYPKMKRKILKDKSKNVEGYGEIYKILLLTIAPVILSTAIYNISETIDLAVFSNVMDAQGHTLKEVSELSGMFTGKYNTLINIPLAIANSLGAALIPSLTATVATGSKRDINSKINMIIRFVMMFAIPCFIGFIVMAEPILDLLYNGNIEIPARMLQLGAITVVFYCMSTVTNAILQGVNKMTTPVKHGAISLVLHLIGLYIMLVFFKWGIYAVVVGNIIFSLSMCILNAMALMRATRYHQEVERTFIIPLEAAGIMGVVILVLKFALDFVLPKPVMTLIVLMFAVIAYGISLIKLGGLTSTEVQALPKGAMIYRLLLKLHLMKEVNE